MHVCMYGCMYACMYVCVYHHRRHDRRHHGHHHRNPKHRHQREGGKGAGEDCWICCKRAVQSGNYCSLIAVGITLEISEGHFGQHLRQVRERHGYITLHYSTVQYITVQTMYVCMYVCMYV